MKTTSQLAACLERLSWSPEQLAREINKRYGSGTISSKAPYNWLKGAVPRQQLPQRVAEVLSAGLGEPVTVQTLWPQRFPSDAGADDRRCCRRIPQVAVEMLDAQVERLRRLSEEAHHELAPDWARQDLQWARRLAAEYTYDADTGARLHRMIGELGRLRHGRRPTLCLAGGVGAPGCSCP